MLRLVFFAERIHFLLLLRFKICFWVNKKNRQDSQAALKLKYEFYLTGSPPVILCKLGEAMGSNLLPVNQEKHVPAQEANAIACASSYTCSSRFETCRSDLAFDDNTHMNIACQAMDVMLFLLTFQQIIQRMDAASKQQQALRLLL
jgi:hypothetical protein